MNHILSLEIPDILNTTILRIVDTSVYNQMVPMDCPLVEVTLPGFVEPVQFEKPIIEPGFAIHLTACALNIQTTDCESSPGNLPDGIYIIKYSLSPKDTIYVEYNHLRVAQLMNKYRAHLCDVPLVGTEPSSDIKARLDQLRLIKSYIDAAKAKVELAHEPKKGMELYTYAKKLLDKMSCNSCY